MSSYQSKTTYTVFFANDKSTNHIWSIKTNNIELIVGILAAGMGIIDDLNRESKSDEIYYIDSDADVSDYRLINSVPEEKIFNSSYTFPGEYGLWMNSGKRFDYSLYRFKTAYFFQGIITLCHAFDVDFRNYIFGFPFDNKGNQYALSGYVMAPYQIVQDAPDLDDIDDEEKDDENIINPLEKDY